MKKINKSLLLCLILLSHSSQSLLSRQAERKVAINNQFTTTSLHEAVVKQYFNKNKKLKLIRELLDTGANVNARNEDLRTPLWLVTFYGGDISIIHLLVEYGADVTMPDLFNVTPLHNLIKRNDMLGAQYLLDAGAIMNPRTAQSMINFKDDGERSPFDILHIDAIDQNILQEALDFDIK